MVTLSPRFFKRRPRLAATIPLPIDETTPPVTKIYFVIKCSFVLYCEENEKMPPTSRELILTSKEVPNK